MDDLVGKKFGKWTILSYDKEDKVKYPKQVRCICDCGNIVVVLFRSLRYRRSKQCKICASKQRRLDYDKVSEYFKSKGCILLDKELRGSKKNLRFVCKCGRIHQKAIDKFRLQPSCVKCATEDKRYSYEEVYKMFENSGCKLLSKYYENSRHELTYLCPNGHESKIIFSYFLSGSRCRKCSYIQRGLNNSGENSYNWVKDRESIKKYKKFRSLCTSILRRCLKTFNKSKESNTHKLLGYSTKDLIKHIESHANWDSVKDNDWHIDHIFPIKAFANVGIYDLKIVNGLDNLQPLSAKENLSKHDKYDYNEFKNWLITKGIIV